MCVNFVANKESILGTKSAWREIFIIELTIKDVSGFYYERP